MEKKSSDKNKAISEAKSEVSFVMKELTELCKQDLDNMKRQKIETLVTIMVYLKDVTTSWRFREATDFEWQKYTRMYWNHDQG